nr:hypothetical protein [Candidatus Cloacimonas sp.]
MPGINCLISAQGITQQTQNTIDNYLQRLEAIFPHLQFTKLIPCREVLISISQHRGYRVYTEKYRGWQIFHELQDNSFLTQAFQ